MFFREEPLLNTTFQKDSKNRTRTSIGHQKAMKTGINTDGFEELQEYNLKQYKEVRRSVVKLQQNSRR